MSRSAEGNRHELSRFPITRRTMLRGVGATLALPWLEAMMPRRATAGCGRAKPPVRMAVLYMPNGVNRDKWTPEGEGRDFKLSPTLEPLADLKDDVLVLTNLWNRAARPRKGITSRPPASSPARRSPRPTASI